jgi:hypothetical protein
LNFSHASFTPALAAVELPEDRDGDAWDGVEEDVAGAAVDVVLSGAGVETLQAVSPARPAMAATASIFFI